MCHAPRPWQTHLVGFDNIAALPTRGSKPMQHKKSWLFACLLMTFAFATPGRAEEFVHRDLTLPSGVWALDLGLGIGHINEPAPMSDVTGLGLNLELKWGLTRALQFGLRTGLRFDTDGKLTEADRYGRTFETETYGTDGETIANPEVSLRYALIDSPITDLALEGRVYLPIESGTKLGFMLAVPMAFHLSPSARFDTGVYVPILLYDPTVTVVSFPFHLWLQANDRLALGLLTGVAIHNPGDTTTVPLGVGLNYGASHDADVRFWFLYPNVKGDGARDVFGGGVGVELRF
jgi:hypothetical protein